MSDFVIDMEAEARRVSHSRRGEKEYTPTIWQSFGKLESRDIKMRDAVPASRATPDNAAMADSGTVLGSSMDPSPPAKTEEPGDWSDLDPLIRELGKPSKSRVFEKLNGSHKSNTLSPVMRDLMKASGSCAGEVTDVG